MRRIILTMALVMVFSLAGMRSSMFAQDNKYTRETLKGLNGIFVGDVIISKDAKLLGLDEKQIKTVVKSNLGLAGIKLLTEKEHASDAGVSVFYVVVDVLKISQDFLIYNIAAKFRQSCHLKRDPEILTWVDTWSSSHFGNYLIKNVQKEIQAQIKHEVDVFINAYLSVNPKKQGGVHSVHPRSPSETPLTKPETHIMPTPCQPKQQKSPLKSELILL